MTSSCNPRRRHQHSHATQQTRSHKPGAKASSIPHNPTYGLLPPQAAFAALLLPFVHHAVTLAGARYDHAGNLHVGLIVQKAAAPRTPKFTIRQLTDIEPTSVQKPPAPPPAPPNKALKRHMDTPPVTASKAARLEEPEDKLDESWRALWTLVAQDEQQSYKIEPDVKLTLEQHFIQHHNDVTDLGLDNILTVEPSITLHATRSLAVSVSIYDRKARTRVRDLAQGLLFPHRPISLSNSSEREQYYAVLRFLSTRIQQYPCVLKHFRNKADLKPP